MNLIPLPCLLRQAKSGVSWPYIRTVATKNHPRSRGRPHHPALLLVAQRWHGGHSHHHGPNPLLSPAHSPEERKAQKVTLLGLGTNVGLSALKGGVGYATGSMSLVADAVHSLTDLLSDIITLGAVRISRQPATDAYPHGFGRIETMGAVSVAAFLLSTSVGISYSAVDQILHGTVALTDGGATWATGAAAISLVAKEALYRITIRVAEDQNSPVLYANAWHHRTDALSSVVALAGVGGSWMGYPLCDPIGGFIVGGILGKIGLDIATTSLTEMMDKSLPVPPALQTKMQAQLEDSAFCLQRINCHKIGPYYYVKVSVSPVVNKKEDKRDNRDLLSIRVLLREAAMQFDDMEVRHFDFCVVDSDDK
eukprot:scaffold1019_cov172-Amphora_coffeaeformis.AAC.9